ncbi:uncharacterized protein LOC135126085 isoform X1 [Zophobas morio]|uniref:uncharacterized protein LOC135126085 isoform X1 n=1 Tax=Zophobas morio TaxID=2755281 RepID=UPI003082B0E2
MACLSVTGAMRTTPRAALETLLCLAPLNLYIEEAAMTTSLRLHSLGVWNKQGRTTKHTRILTEAFNRIPLLRMGCDRMGTKLIYEKTYSISMNDNSEGRADIDIYVDGAKTDSGSGAGIYSEQLNAQISVPLGTHTSVLQTELMGIMLGARIIAEREIGNKSIRILTDSKSALLALDSCMVRSGLVWECRQTLKYVTQRNSVELCWIKRHSGNEGNERADEMAKRAARMPFWGPEPAITPSVALSNELVKQYTQRCHEQIWVKLSSCRHSRACMATPDRKLTKFYLSLSRDKLRKLVGFLTGHYQFNKHLHTIGVVTDPICRGCNEEEETAEHILRECPALASYRESILGDIWPSMANIREFPPSALLKYIQAVGWLDE